MMKDSKTARTSILLLILCCLFLVAACESQSAEENVTYVVVPADFTPENVSVQAQAPTEAPTDPPPTATPDTPPEIALQIGDRYLLDGYYENAVYTYQTILDRGEAAPSDIRAAAAFGQAQAALREGLFDYAVESLTLLIEQFSQDNRAIQAYFLRGDAYLGLSRWQDAINDFQRYLELRPGLIDSYAYERIGDAQIALERFDDAFTSYNRATEATRSLVPQLALREKVAQLHTLSGQLDLAIAQYDAILEVAQNAPYRALIDFRAAQALVSASDMERGLARMQGVFNDYEQQPQAYDAMLVLLENGRNLDNYAIGRVSYFKGDYERTIEAFNNYTSQTQLAAIPAELHLLLGRAYRAVGNSEAAQVAFRTLIDRHPTDPLFGEALLETGRTRFLNNEIDQAIARYLEIAENYSYLAETAAEALWRAAYLYGTNDNQSESRRLFLQLADNFPNTEQARSGLFLAAAAALDAGDSVNAETLYARLATTTTGSEQSEAYLQVGRLALERGDTRAAESAFAMAATSAPDTYFSARAQDIADGQAPFSPPDEYVFEFDDLADVTAAENWLRETFGVQQEGPLWPLSAELEAEPRVVRGRELWAVGAFSEAQTEFLDVLAAYKDDGLASYQLAIFMRIVGAYYPSIVGAANVITAANTSTLEAPAYIARMRYPAYYRDVVLRVTDQRDIDPLLLFSLIRHESLFNTNATAAAEEKGLTQVIPNTAQYIAEQLNWPDYKHSDLFRPYAGIEFGAFFLQEQLQRFNGNTYAALAGYNAGPGRAIAWMDLSGGDPDRFMSAITISSTRQYIQLIYSSYNIYRELYGA